MTDGALRVGLLGLGNMGAPTAHNLVSAGLDVAVWARRPESTAPFDDDALVVASLGELARRSRVVVAMLPDLPQLADLLDGDEGLVAGFSAGDDAERRVLVVCSSSSPQGVRDLADDLDDRTGGRVGVVDAPVSGGTEGAEAGTLSIMVGGSPGDVDLVRPVLEAMGAPAHLGPVGSGEVAKACNQLVVASTMLALAEATTLAERAGIDIRALLDVLGAGYAGGRFLEAKKERLIAKDHSVQGAAAFMVKDLGIAHDEAVRTGTASPGTDALLAVYRDLVDRGLGDDDLTVAQAYITSLSREDAPGASGPRG